MPAAEVAAGLMRGLVLDSARRAQLHAGTGRRRTVPPTCRLIVAFSKDVDIARKNYRRGIMQRGVAAFLLHHGSLGESAYRMARRFLDKEMKATADRSISARRDRRPHFGRLYTGTGATPPPRSARHAAAAARCPG